MRNIKSICDLDLLGIKYEKEEKFELARQTYESSRSKGSSIAANNLGMMYLKGYGVEKDMYKAQAYWKESVKMGDASGMMNLAMLYLHNEMEIELAIDLLKKAAQGGVNLANYELGVYYFENTEYSTAKEYFEISSANGDVQSTLWIGRCHYELGEYAKAKIFFQKAVSEKNLEGKSFLGIYLIEQEENVKSGLEFLNDALIVNEPYAMAFIAKLHILGKHVEQDVVRGVDLFKKSADLGNKDAAYTLGMLYYEGSIVRKDIHAAHDLIVKSGKDPELSKQLSKELSVLSGRDVSYLLFGAIALLVTTITWSRR